MNLIEAFQGTIQACGAAPAIIEPHRRGLRTTTFAELDHRSAQAAALLVSLGLRAGDQVLVLQPMGAELYAAVLAVLRLGMVVIAVDPSAGLAHVERCCALLPPRGLIANWKAHLLRLVSPALRRVPVQVAIGCPVPGAARWSRLGGMAPHATIVSADAETPALLTFTSGSTGQPKGVVRSHGLLLAQHSALSRCLHLASGQIDLTTMPIVMLSNLASGVTSVIPRADLRRPGFIHPAPIVQQIRQCQVTRSVASPAFLERLADYCRERGITLPTLRELYTGGAPVFPRLLDEVQTIAPNAEVVALYGSTEAEPIADISLRDISTADRESMIGGRGLIAGRPVAEVSLRVIADNWGTPLGSFAAAEFDALRCAPRQPGEIVVTGEHVLKGYLGGAGDAETKFCVDGVVWHRTGDAGMIDESGRLWLLGRCVARIDDERGRLYPLTVEAAAHVEPQVEHAAVIGHRGRRILLLQWRDASQPGNTKEIQDRLRWAHIDEVRVWRRLPLDARHNAKLDYPALSRQLQLQDSAH